MRTNPEPRHPSIWAGKTLGASLGVLLAVSMNAPLAGAEENTTPTRRDVREAKAAVATTRDSVEAVESELAAANARLQEAAVAAERAAEAYNGVRWALEQSEQELAEAQRRQQRADEKLAEQRDAIGVLVSDGYQSGAGVGALGVVFSADGPEALMSDYLSLEGASSALEADLAAFAAAAAVAEGFRVQAQAARAENLRLTERAEETLAAANAAADDAQRLAASTATRKTELIAELARVQGVSVAVAQARQAALEQRAAEAAAAAAAAAAAEAAAQQQVGPGSGGGSGKGSGVDAGHVPTAPSTPPAVGGGAGAAINFARAQIGEPYEWGAAGPDSWDCSGLTMGAWRAGGKSLPHYSVAQYDASTPIASGDLAPGDLVFWGSSDDPESIFHVALYIGDGQIIHAPRTGEDVRIDSMYYWTPPNFFGRV